MSHGWCDSGFSYQAWHNVQNNEAIFCVCSWLCVMSLRADYLQVQS